MDTADAWAQFLDPKILRTHLIAASLYITTFEMLKASIVDRVKSFYVDGFDEDGFIFADEYKTRVLSRHKSVTQASILWLQELGALDVEDISRFHALRVVRNDLAHEMLNVLSGKKEVHLQDRFAEVIALLRKIDVWWIVNVEIDINPEFEGKSIDDIDVDEIIPGSMMICQLLMDVALGDDERANQYLGKLAEIAQQRKG